MAKIVFSLEELIQILIANELLPGQIQKPKAKDQTVEFVIKTGVVILPAVPVSLKYMGFEDNRISFEITVAGGRFSDVIGGYAKQFESKMPPGVKLDFPLIHVDADQLLEARNIRGLRVSDIVLENGEFTVTTSPS